MMTRLASLLAVAVAVLALGGQYASVYGADASTEVVVTLRTPPLARPPARVRELDAEQRTFRAALAEHVPAASISWSYRLVANGFAVSLPARLVSELQRLPGVREVYGTAQYGAQLDQSPGQIGAPAVWGARLETAGEGMKIGIIDSGVDATHKFFDPTGYAMPPGFPKGQVSHTTAKVIVARAFAPPGAQASAREAFGADSDSHGTHVAGIAAGNDATRASGGRVVSGVAPRAYIGNYRVFVPTPSGVSPNANSPEIVAAIEAAVADGMDVINFSGGEPEIEPSRDIVALALDAAADAGVIPVVAAGNEFDNAGIGSVGSPANSAKAIAVGAVEVPGNPTTSVHAEFSSVGPTQLSLRLKPDVAAPGVDILSSVPGGWSSISGTSMASPHVAGAAALLKERHPEWTVAQIKSALVQSGVDARLEESNAQAGPSFVGGGMIAVAAADQPLLFAVPSSLSWRFLQPGSTLTGSVRLDDAGGGAGTWQVSLEQLRAPAGTSVVSPDSVAVPGALSYEVKTARSAPQGEVSGYFALRNGVVERRIPFWARVAVDSLARHKTIALGRQGVRRGTTAGHPAFVSRYRYPEDPRGLGVSSSLAGPETVYRIRLARRVANFGVRVTQRGHGVRVEPRVVSGLDENRLAGYPALPLVVNPYLEYYGVRIPVAGALLPRRGEYAIVFDSPTKAGAGRFSFRYWVNDVTAPSVRLLTKTVSRVAPIALAVSDKGSGVFPQSIVATIDGRRVDVTYRRGRVRIPTRGLALGKHRLRVRVSDYQETRNTENVARILPNTRILDTTLTVG
jgi:subtilisin family serine protease